jgi:hypothetical protein
MSMQQVMTMTGLLLVVFLSNGKFNNLTSFLTQGTALVLHNFLTYRTRIFRMTRNTDSSVVTSSSK